jgi:nucleoside-diphosphate-sugar epimerase
VEILITGGGGLLGRHLVPTLLDRGDQVRVLALPGENVPWLDELGVGIHRGDIRDRQSLLVPMEGVDAVLHLAGMMGVWRPLDDYRAVNVTGAENVCRTALAQGVSRIVHVSSWTVYGIDVGRPCTENFPLRPFADPYAVTKAEGDRLVQRMIAEDGLPAAIVRPGTFFGPGDGLHFGRIADRLRAGKGVVIGRGDNALPFVYVTDVVQGLLLGLDHERAVGQAFNITNDQPLSQQEFMETTAAEVGGQPPRVHLPYRLLDGAAYTIEHLARVARLRRQPPVTQLGVKLFGTDNRHAIDKARRELGYSPKVTIRDGIRLSASWYSSGSLAPNGGTRLAMTVR